MGSGRVEVEAGRIGGGLEERLAGGGYGMDNVAWVVLGRWEVVCQTHVEPVA